MTAPGHSSSTIGSKPYDTMSSGNPYNTTAASNGYTEDATGQYDPTATNTSHVHGTNGDINNQYPPPAVANMTPAQRKRFNYGGNPLAREQTYDEERLPAFGGELQPGQYKQDKARKIANPAPLGLSAFALTTFVLSLLNMGTRGQGTPNLVVALAFGYGGLVQLLAGMWEMAIGNTFGATALSSYGGFWISFGIIFTPGGFGIVDAYATEADFFIVFSFYLFGWFIFTFLMLMCTLRATVAFFFLFFTLDLAFLMLALAYYFHGAAGANVALNTAGGVFGILAAFAAWYNALAGLLEPSNSFFLIPVAHFPWSAKGREARGKDAVGTVLGHHPEEEKTE